MDLGQENDFLKKKKKADVLMRFFKYAVPEYTCLWRLLLNYAALKIMKQGRSGYIHIYIYIS